MSDWFKSRRASYLSVLCIVLSVGVASDCYALQRGEQIRIPLLIADDFIGMSVDISGNGTRQEYMLVLDLESKEKISLIKSAREWFKSGIGGSSEVELEFSDGAIEKLEKDSLSVHEGDVKFGDVSRENEKKFGGRPIAGVIGLGFLRQYSAVLDVKNRYLLLQDSELNNSLNEPNAQSLVVPVEQTGSGALQLPLISSGGAAQSLVLGSTAIDTQKDEAVMKELDISQQALSEMIMIDHTNGNSIDLRNFLALREGSFAQLDLIEGTSAVFRSGRRFLEIFRIAFDFKNNQIKLTQTSFPNFPAEDEAYFLAESKGALENYQNYMTTYPESRYKLEALTKVLWLAMEGESGVDYEYIIDVYRIILANVEEGKRTEHCLRVAERIKSNYSDRMVVALKVAQMGFEFSGKAHDGIVIYELHNTLGELYLRQGEMDNAWRHLLSASFGKPNDLKPVMNLGRVYEHQKRYRRAYALYKKIDDYITSPISGMDFNSESDLKSLKARARVAMDRLVKSVSLEELERL